MCNPLSTSIVVVSIRVVRWGGLAPGPVPAMSIELNSTRWITVIACKEFPMPRIRPNQVHTNCEPDSPRQIRAWTPSTKVNMNERGAPDWRTNTHIHIRAHAQHTRTNSTHTHIHTLTLTRTHTHTLETHTHTHIHTGNTHTRILSTHTEH